MSFSGGVAHDSLKMNYKKKIKDIGIDTCENPSQVGIRLHPKSIKMWLGIVIMIIALAGSGAKTWDWFWYDMLKYPRNTEEKVINHMIYGHLFTGEKPEGEKVMQVRKKTCKLVSTEYSDGCVSTRLINKEGIIEGLKVHATKQTIAMLAKRHIHIMREAEAGYQRRFDLGFHTGDRNYAERRGKYRGEIIRTYWDKYKCTLSYIIDDRYGNTYGWRWEVYRH